MVFKNVLLFGFLLNLISDRTTLADNTIVFDIKSSNSSSYLCNAPTTLQVQKDEPIDVTVVGSADHLNHAFCSLKNSSDNFLVKDNFKKKENSFTTKIINATNAHNGSWNCTFLIRQDVLSPQNYVYNNVTYIKVSCETQVTVKGDIFEGIDSKTMWYIIGGAVGAIIIIIIIAQTAVIMHFKAKAAAALPRLERRSAQRDDTARYSTMPGERKRSRKRREDSGIYQSLENINMHTYNSGSKPAAPAPIHERPPLPLPTDDDEHIYDDGETLSRIFAPIPPSVDTLPKNKGKKGQGGKNKPLPTPKPTPMEEYDYTDTMELLKPQEYTGRPKKNPIPVPPKPGKMKPEVPIAAHKMTAKSMPGGDNMMNELGNILKRKNINAQPPITEATPGTRQGIRPYMPSHAKPSSHIPSHAMPPPHMPSHAMSSPHTPSHAKPSPHMQSHAMPSLHQPSHDTPAPLMHQDRAPYIRGPESMHCATVRPTFREDRRPSQEVLPPVIPPVVMAPNVARSPPVSRFRPMGNTPTMNASTVKSPPVPTKPNLGPLQTANSRINKPPPPTPPIEEEEYDMQLDVDHSSDDEWTYEPLPQYNIYNN